MDLDDDRADATDDLPAALPYDLAAVAPAGALVFTAGACPLDAHGAVVAPGDHGAQTRQVLLNLRAVLARHGAAPRHLVRTTVYVVGDRDALGAVWAIYAQELAPARPPSTLVGVTTLGYAGQVVEIDAVAALPG